MGRDWLRGNVKRKVKVKSLSCVWLFATPWTGVYQNPPSMGFSRQEYWSGLPFPSSGDLPTPGIEPWSPTLQADALPSEPPGKSTEGKLGLILMGRAMLSKSLIQFSVPSLLFDLKPNYGGGNWESQFLGKLIGSLGVPKERGVWNSQGGRKDSLWIQPFVILKC